VEALVALYGNLMSPTAVPCMTYRAIELIQQQYLGARELGPQAAQEFCERLVTRLPVPVDMTAVVHHATHECTVESTRNVCVSGGLHPEYFFQP
jgi:hypothetical protein